MVKLSKRTAQARTRVALSTLRRLLAAARAVYEADDVFTCDTTASGRRARVCRDDALRRAIEAAARVVTGPGIPKRRHGLRTP